MSLIFRIMKKCLLFRQKNQNKLNRLVNRRYILPTPIDNINDGHEFQRIVAEYFRCLKKEKHEYQISDVKVEDLGVGPDDGCDILVEFYFEDAIGQHTKRWVVECKSQKRSVGNKDINIDNLQTILRINKADGYLLVCKTDASTSLKRILRELNKDNLGTFEVWNGTHLWSQYSKREGFLKAFFPDYYKEKFIDSGIKDGFEEAYKKLKKELG